MDAAADVKAVEAAAADTKKAAEVMVIITMKTAAAEADADIATNQNHTE